MQQASLQAQGGPIRPQHGKELCLLSLDGGGVRGLSALCILEEMMRKVDPENPPRPSQYFDLIGGTSTGGLIAIMLGRLQMSIEDCRQAYRDLSDEAFQLQNYQAAPAFRMPWNWDLKARFDSAALERGIKRIIVRELRRDPGNDSKTDEQLEDTLLKDEKSTCRVFVTATSASMPDRTSILTTYESNRWPRDLLDSVKIWEAARATSAASTFFERIQIGPDGETFLDGATGANNPINVVWDEARDIWPSDKPLEDDVQCVVSIGTGVPTVKAFGSSLKEIGETLKAMSTETETTAEAFLRRYTRLHSEDRYFRFNVLSGLGDIGLEEAARRPEIVTATRRYLSSEEHKKQLENCAKNLRFREWYAALPRVIERAHQEHSAAIERLKMYGTNRNSNTQQSPMWFKNMPEYQRWISRGCGTLYYLDNDGAAMSELVSNIVQEGQSRCLGLCRTIYLDCSQFDSSNPEVAEMGALHSLLYQNIHIHVGSLQRLSDYFQTLRQPVGRSFDRLFHENTIDDTRPDCSFMVDALRWIMPVEPAGITTIIDKIHCMEDLAWRQMLDHLLSKINDEADHILFVSRNDPEIMRKVAGMPTISPEVETLRCIESLHFNEWDDRRSVVETPFRDTDDWVWTHPAFLRWKEKSGILWIKGKPGSGKSTIARMITDKLAESKKHQPSIDPGTKDNEPNSTIAANFFYSARMGERATRHRYMLRSILYQMLRQDHSLYVHFKSVYRNLLAADTEWALKDLMLIFGAIIQDCSSERSRFCCVLDGFDESDEIDCSQIGHPRPRKAQLLSWLADLAQKDTGGSCLKVLVLSRPTNSISRELGAMASITVEDHNLPAIEKLVDDGLTKIKQSIMEWMRTDCGGYPDAEAYIQTQQIDVNDTLRHLTTRILEKADGTIQWVVTVLGELQSQFDRKGVYTRGELEEVLDSLPEGLDELYEELVKRLQSRLTASELCKAHNMLAWVCFARRPLALDEFRDALALDGWKDSKPLDELQKHLHERRLRLFQEGNWAPVEREIIDTCGCLLEVVKPASASIQLRPGSSSCWTRAEFTVQVTHQTVKEFLLKGGDKAGPLNLVEEQCSSYLSLGISTYFRSSILTLERALATRFAPTVIELERHSLSHLIPWKNCPESAFEGAARHLQDRPLLAYIIASADYNAKESNLFTSARDDIQELMDHFLERCSRSSVTKVPSLPARSSPPLRSDPLRIGSLDVNIDLNIDLPEPQTGDMLEGESRVYEEEPWKFNERYPALERRPPDSSFDRNPVENSPLGNVLRYGSSVDIPPEQKDDNSLHSSLSSGYAGFESSASAIEIRPAEEGVALESRGETRQLIRRPSSSTIETSSASDIEQERQIALEDLRLSFQHIPTVQIRNSDKSSSADLKLSKNSSFHSFTPHEEAIAHKFEAIILKIFEVSCCHSLFAVLRLLFENNLPHLLALRAQCLIAIEAGNLPLADILLPRALYSSTADLGALSTDPHSLYSVFSNLVKEDADDTVRLLLHHYPILAKIWDEDYITPFHFAASHCSMNSALILIEKASDLDQSDCLGRTPLIIAAKRGHGPFVELLLNQGADQDIADTAGRTALYHAICSGDKRSIRALTRKDNVLDYMNDALRATFDTYVEGGHASEYKTHFQNYGRTKRRHSWPSTPDLSQATCSRLNLWEVFPPQKRYTLLLNNRSEGLLGRGHINEFANAADRNFFPNEEEATLFDIPLESPSEESMDFLASQTSDKPKKVSCDLPHENLRNRPRKRTIRRTQSGSGFNEFKVEEQREMSSENMPSVPKMNILGTVWPQFMGFNHLSTLSQDSRTCYRQDSID